MKYILYFLFFKGFFCQVFGDSKKMPPKREQSLWKGLWQIAQSYEQSYGLKGLLSGGIVAFAMLPPFYREQCVREAKRLTETGENWEESEFLFGSKEWQEKAIKIANGLTEENLPTKPVRPPVSDAVDAIKYATVHYEMLSKEDKEVLDELRRILSPPTKPKKRRARGG